MVKNLTTEQRKIISGKKIMIEVSPYEASVIYELRKHSHAEVIVQMLDGIPYRCKLNISVMMENTEDFDNMLAQLSKAK